MRTTTPAPPAASRPVPLPRTPAVDLDAPVPRRWFAGNAVATHVANGVNVLFPAGERFFVRSVNRWLDRVDEGLRAQARGFFGQEGRHARAHERVIAILEEQGYRLGPFLRAYERLAYGVIEPLAPPWLRLATTAAAEHFTAILAGSALDGGLLDDVDATMRGLLAWHAAEEIEHRAVAFDVLAQVSPGYWKRIAGLAMATACLGGFWAAATATLLAQERRRGEVRLLAEWRRARRRRRTPFAVFARGIREYLRQSFHPSHATHLDALARDYLARAGYALEPR